MTYRNNKIILRIRPALRIDGARLATGFRFAGYSGADYFTTRVERSKLLAQCHNYMLRIWAK